MWCDEVERIGFQRCTRGGYILREAAFIIWILAGILLVGSLAALIFKAIQGSFRWGLLWFPLVSIGMAGSAIGLQQLSSLLARRRGFNYDYETREARWSENGEQCTYNYADWKSD